MKRQTQHNPKTKNEYSIYKIVDKIFSEKLNTITKKFLNKVCLLIESQLNRIENILTKKHNGNESKDQWY